MATLALNSGLWVRRLLNSFGEGCAYGGSPFQGRCPASEVNDGGCPEKPDHLNRLRFLRADIAAAPNHSRDKIKEQIWDEDQAHLQKMDWQVKPTFLNAGVIWYGGTPASLHISQAWHLHWLDSVRRTSRWRDQTAFNHTITQAKDLSIHYLGHEWNAQYWANRSTSSGARIWHTYATAGSMAERQNELFFMACQQVLSGAEGGLNADSAVIKALVNHPSPFTS
jgi:hypothetical protein